MTDDPYITISAGAFQDATKMVPIPAGDAGTDATIEAMRALALHGAKSQAIRNLAADLKGDNWETTLQSVFTWFKKNVKFVRDPGSIERVQTPELMLAKIQTNGYADGDCDCLAPLLVSVLLAITSGHPREVLRPAFVVMGLQPAPAEFAHVFSAMYLAVPRLGDVPPPIILPAGHFPENALPQMFFPMDPQEEIAPGRMRPGAKRIRVYPVYPVVLP